MPMNETYKPILSESLNTPVTDEDYQASGYATDIIQPTADNGLENPFEIWKKTSDEGIELEVVGCKELFSWGDTYEEAELNLIELIRENASYCMALHTLDAGKAEVAHFANQLVRTVHAELLK